jgi:hypothetical protein
VYVLIFFNLDKMASVTYISDIPPSLHSLSDYRRLLFRNIYELSATKKSIKRDKYMLQFIVHAMIS